MDFFKSLNEVRKNSNQLNAWEQQQKDKDAKRKAYQDVHAPSEVELERAKNLGETLINAIDVMDNHSESIAQNIETATEQLGSLTMLAGGVIPGWLSYKLAVKPAEKAMREAKEVFDNNEENKKLAQEICDNAHERWSNGHKSKAYIEVSDLRKKPEYSGVNNIIESEYRNKALRINQQFNQSIRKHKNKVWWMLSVPIGMLAGWFFGNMWGTKLEVNSSRVARYQARRELEDPKNFVDYTDEQIAQAKENLAKQPKKRKKDKDNLKTGFFSSIASVIKDNKAYKNDVIKRSEQGRIVNRELSDEELLQAEKDKEVIQRVVKVINNEAEKNAENMEVAAAVIMGVFPVVSGGIGTVLGWALQKTGYLNKKIGKYLEKNNSEEVIDAFKKYSSMKDGEKGRLRAFGEFIAKYEKEISDGNIKLKGKVHSSGIKEPSIFKKALMHVIAPLANPKIAKWAIGGAASILAIIPSALIALKLEKESSRAGRYNAKRELEKNPANFIGYSQKELDELGEIKENRKGESKIKQYALFLPRVFKQYYAYQKYKKTEYKEKQALNKELHKLEVTDQQVKDAKNLQNKVFNTFEVVDDKSQSYSEATEAAIETLQPLVYGTGAAAMVTPLIIGGVQIAKARKNPGQMTAKITKFVAKRTKILNSKLFKKYLKGVDKNVSTVVSKQVPKSEILNGTLAGINLAETPVIEILQKLPNNLRASLSKELHSASLSQQKEIFENIIKYITKIENTLAMSSKFKESVAKIKISDKLSELYWRMYDIDDPKLRAEILDVVTGNTSKMSAERLSEVKDIMSRNHISSEFGDTLNNFEKAINDIKASPAYTQIEQIMKDNNVLNSISKVTLKDVKDKGIAGVKIIGQLNNIEIFKQIDNPKAMLENFSKYIDKMSDDEFMDFILQTPMKKFTKQNCKDILGDLAKVWDNIPKEESKKIFATLFKEFNENPDQVLAMVNSGKVEDIFKTPEIKRALTIAGISWTAFTAIMTYVIEAWLAEIQLRAGRLGVKMAMDELQDPKNYANIEQ